MRRLLNGLDGVVPDLSWRVEAFTIFASRDEDRERMTLAVAKGEEHEESVSTLQLVRYMEEGEEFDAFEVSTVGVWDELECWQEFDLHLNSQDNDLWFVKTSSGEVADWFARAGRKIGAKVTRSD